MQRLNFSFLRPLLVLCCLVPAGAENHFLRTLAETGGGVVVAYGTEATSREAATIIRDEIRTLDGHETWDNLVPGAEFDARDFKERGQTHIIAVGRLADNAALRQKDRLPAWWLDRDWYYSQYDYALHLLPYQAKTGFVAAGYGEWESGTDGVGYICVRRSRYFMEWFVRSKYPAFEPDNKAQWDKEIKPPFYPKDTPMRLMVTVTGSGGAGVKAAAEAFARNGLLHGAVLGGSAGAAAGPGMTTLSADQYARSLPFTAPASDNDAACTYLGWLLPSAFFYNGFVHDMGVKPKQMYRLKYNPGFSISNFWTTPHRRAGQFEVCVLLFDSPDQARTAEQTIAAVAAGKEYADRITGLTVVRDGAVVCVESIPGAAGEELVHGVLRSVKESL